MLSKLDLFEKIVRRISAEAESTVRNLEPQPPHPFETRNIHSRLPKIVKDLFDDGHFAQATFEAFKFIDKEVQKHSNLKETGYRLMMAAFQDNSPSIKLTPLSNQSEQDEQKGYQFLFAGSALAIRNPRGHEYGIKDDIDTCLDHLSLASIFIRRLEQSNYM